MTQNTLKPPPEIGAEQLLQQNPLSVEDDFDKFINSSVGLIRRVVLTAFFENKDHYIYGTLVGTLLFALRQTFEPWLNRHSATVSLGWLTWYWTILICIAIVKLSGLALARRSVGREMKSNLKLIRQKMKRGELTKKQAQCLNAQILELHIQRQKSGEKEKTARKDRAETIPDEAAIPFIELEAKSKRPMETRSGELLN